MAAKTASAKTMRGVRTTFGNAVATGAKTAKPSAGGRRSSRGGGRTGR